MNNIPLVSIVIPAYNEVNKIRKTLHKIVAQDYSHFEVIVVDDGSTDGTIEGVQQILSEYEKPFQIIRQQNRGAAAARNAGWQRAEGEIIAFIDAGCHASSTWLSDLVKDIGKADAIGGKIILTAEHNALARYAQAARHYRHRVSDDGKQVEYLITANAAYRRAVLETVGGFHEWLGVGGEDVDLSYRANHAGYEMRITDRAVVEHNDAADNISQFAIKFFNRGYANYFYSADWQEIGYYKRSPQWEIIRRVGALILSPYLALRYASRRRWLDFPAYWLIVIVEHLFFSLGLLKALLRSEHLHKR